MNIKQKIQELREKRDQFIAQKDWEQAAKVSQEMIELDPKPHRFHKQGHILIKLKRYQGALHNLEKALELDPDSPKIKKSLAKIRNLVEDKSAESLDEKQEDSVIFAKSGEVPSARIEESKISPSKILQEGEKNIKELFTTVDEKKERTLFGRYRIIKEIGEGGMGKVYQAHDPELDRTVALKEIKTHNSNAVKRFLREAKAMAKLSHPYIVSIYDFGKEEGLPFFTMDFIDGLTLKDWRKKKRSIPQIVDLMILVGEGVQYAHEQKIIHRDLKPANILVTKDAKPKIMDFGLAKILTGDQDISQSGALIGTLQYMPPEQADGRIKEIDKQSDVYSLGAILYELLTARPIFEGTRLNILSKIALTAPTPPSKFNRSISQELENIVLKALAKKKKQRYKNVAVFIKDLKKLGNKQQKKKKTSFNKVFLILFLLCLCFLSYRFSDFFKYQSAKQVAKSSSKRENSKSKISVSKISESKISKRESKISESKTSKSKISESSRSKISESKTSKSKISVSSKSKISSKISTKKISKSSKNKISVSKISKSEVLKEQSKSSQKSVERKEKSEIDIGQTGHGYIKKKGRNHLKFKIATRATYVIYTLGSTDTRGEIYDSNKKRIHYDSNSGIQKNFRIKAKLKPGEYYIRVQGEYSSTTGTYKICFEGPGAGTQSDDHGYSIYSAAPIKIGSITSAKLDIEGDDDYFQFTVKKTAIFVMYTRSDINTYGKLFNVQYKELGSDYNSAEENNFWIYKKLTPGTYYIQVSGYNGRTTGDYNLHLEGPQAATKSDDHGYSIYSATASKIGRIIKGKIDIAGDDDYFQFTVKKTATYVFYSRSFINVYGKLYDAQYKELVYDNNSAEESNFWISRKLTPGIYYVMVAGYNNDVLGNYSLHMEGPKAPTKSDDHGFSIYSSTKVKFFKPTPGTIDVPGDADYFKFYIPQERIYTVSLKDITAKFYGELYNKDYNRLDYARFNDENSYLRKKLKPGLYYFMVSGQRETTGDYKILVKGEKKK